MLLPIELPPPTPPPLKPDDDDEVMRDDMALGGNCVDSASNFV